MILSDHVFFAGMLCTAIAFIGATLEIIKNAYNITPLCTLLFLTYALHAVVKANEQGGGEPK